MKKILLVEDDKALATELKYLLNSAEIECSIATTIDECYRLLDCMKFDVAILDRIVTDGDTLEIVQYLHDSSFQTRILFVSNLHHVRERIRGLESGGDDYLPKPFSTSELILRINNLLCKHKLQKNNSLCLGPIQILPEQGILLINNRPSQMRKKEMALLHSLILHKNHVLTKDQLITQVWGTHESIPNYNTLDVYIRRIRMHLGPYKSLIRTARGFGYTATWPGAT